MDHQTHRLPDDSIARELEVWKQSYDRDKDVPYLFSSEWEEFEKLQWEDYERLRSLQQTAGLPPLAWQKSMEGFRDEMLQDRLTTYSPLQERHLEFCPLSIHLDRCSTPYVNRQDRRYPWKAALSNWDTFGRLFRDGSSTFRSRLSPMQRSAYIVLRDWWSSTYCDRQLANAARVFMEQRMEVSDLSNPIATDFTRTHGKSTMAEYSLYHSDCFVLFVMEFHPRLWEPYKSSLSLRILQDRRAVAASIAKAQRLAYSSLWPNVPDHLRVAESLRYPLIQVKVNPWITSSDSDNMPYYLWDTRLRKTIIAAELSGNSPEYLCISHTWGRWRVDPPSLADIPGIPWPVPRNTKFNVERLPQDLAKLGARCRYVWMDLFCIPQEWSTRADIEIARQVSCEKMMPSLSRSNIRILSWRGYQRVKC